VKMSNSLVVDVSFTGIHLLRSGHFHTLESMRRRYPTIQSKDLLSLRNR